MKKKLLVLMLGLTMVLSFSLLTACGSGSGDAPEGQSDADAAAGCAALIDGIYVQEWSEETDDLCIAAKAAWDALTDEQKAMVEGEFADPDYFGRDTGDASLDDPLNQDDIGENELLVVSFGTSFNESRANDIGGIEKALQEANPDWSVRRAFTAQIIINHVFARDGEKIDNVDQALQRAVDNGVKNLVVQPTHLMHGAEYDELVGVLENYKDKFETVKVAEPLLGTVGEDATVVNADKEAVAKAVVAEAVAVSDYDSLEAAAADGTAFVFMGHGTSHTAAVTYDQMQEQMKQLGYGNVFVGTVEGKPEDTAFPAVKKALEDAGYTKVILRPLMVVAGDHANNDMAGDEEGSWYYGMVNGGEFEVEGADAPVDTGAGLGAENVSSQIEGLGRIPEVQKIYVAHTAEAINM
ncbi:MAG: sirohydrochlorin cobaltochelatase [Mogibacterium sp.]|nr:sirohydrochlorin cobaltochelatase [Mogibacterium sp.]